MKIGVPRESQAHQQSESLQYNVESRKLQKNMSIQRGHSFKIERCTKQSIRLVRNINMIVITKLIIGNDDQQFKAVPSKESNVNRK